MFANLGDYFKCLDLNYEYYKKKKKVLVWSILSMFILFWENKHFPRSHFHNVKVTSQWTVQSLYFENPKFPTSCHLLCLYSLVCVGPVAFLMTWLIYWA